MNIIEVSNLTKKYKRSDKLAVDNISFQVEEGEFFAFLGPNGAGKTTTISILTTTLAKTEGIIKIAGFDVDTQPAQVRANIGVIFQKPSLDENLTAEENIRLHTLLYKMYDFTPSYKLMPQQYKDKVMELSEIIGLKDEMFKPIKTFSGGMKRKLEIMRTLMHKPKVLFLDEPTSGLDPQSRKNLWNYLEEIRKKEKITIFLTTHYLDEAEDANRVCIINHGKIVINDSINNIKNKLVNDSIYLETENISNLKHELKDLNYNFEDFENGLKVQVQNADVQKLIKTIQTKLKRINVMQPSLEEAYLNMVKDKSEEQA